MILHKVDKIFFIDMQAAYYIRKGLHNICQFIDELEVHNILVSAKYLAIHRLKEVGSLWYNLIYNVGTFPILIQLSLLMKSDHFLKNPIT